MNNERAIELLHRISDSQFDGPHGDERLEALEMAVRALEGDGDAISRKMAIDAVNRINRTDNWKTAMIWALTSLPSAQSERDIPVKPIETTDRAWGIPHRQAVCPKCDYYLGHVAFLGDYKGKRITYCETCGQAIDWEGWDFDE